MNPYLRQNVLGTVPKLPITDEQFKAAAAARTVLSAAFALEESNDLLIGNYVEFEQELLMAAASNSVRRLNEYHDFFELRSTINRRVVNLLTATRLYLDQTPQRLTDCATTPENARIEFKQRTHHHYDATFGYRFLEALRNHVQHCGLAVHRLSQSQKWVGEDETRVLELSIQPFTERQHLENNNFKKAILSEMPEQVALTLVIREYLQCIGDLHQLVRDHFSEKVKAARQTIEEHLCRYAEQNNGSVVGLTAFNTSPEGIQETIPILLDWDDVRLKLVARNSRMTSLGRHVVTGRAQ
ncbi:hypothetical protein [Chitinibacter sp. GC72]|uniref:hypothetical protein n=1 Tax=Chitinibacter sp. GC72 TaxID=1526917 RepID=UPI0012F80897|nr:hypothetical protein [Chitinibacter sp. GC72]